MNSDPLLKKKQFFADFLYKSLISLPRSEDTSLNFYGMELAKQNTTEEGLKKFSMLVASDFIEQKVKQNGN